MGVNIVHNIIAIDERDSTISLIFELSLNWTDHRVLFQFLKQDSSRNILPEYLKLDSSKILLHETIWFPQYQLSILKDFSAVDDRLGEVSFINTREPQVIQPPNKWKERERRSTYINTNDNLIQPIESYLGNETIIRIKKMIQNNFICSFGNISLYPFDTESCQIRFEYIGIAQLVDLIPGDLLIHPSSFGDYKVFRGETYIYKKGENKVAFNIILGRNFKSIFLFCKMYFS